MSRDVNNDSRTKIKLSRTRTNALSSRTENKDFRLSRHLSCNKYENFRGQVTPVP